ncbi:MAG: hypothetical protein OXG15_00050, partial [Gammaproteobacteria bacterium]|nr:hypothetical protein [Gammaproteobacteria bacterium]
MTRGLWVNPGSRARFVLDSRVWDRVRAVPGGFSGGLCLSLWGECQGDCWTPRLVCCEVLGRLGPGPMGWWGRAGGFPVWWLGGGGGVAGRGGGGGVVVV